MPAAASAADCGRLQSAGVLPVTMQAWGPPLWPCPGTRACMAPRAPACCSAGEGASPCSRGYRQPLASRRCPDFLPDRLGGGDPQRPGAGAAGGAPVSPAAGDCCHPEAGDRLGCPAGPGAGPAAGGAGVRRLGEGGARRGCSPSGWPTRTRVGGRRLSQRGVAVQAGLHCAPLAHATGGTVPPAPCASAFLPSTPAERWNVSSNTWQGWDRNEQKRPGFQGAFLSRRG